MILIVGLGNPGKQYKNTRHNVGYLVIDELQKKKLPKGVVVKKTGVYMNESGGAVKKLMENGRASPEAMPAARRWKIENLYVIHDDLDIPLGQFKIQFAKGPKEHKGIQSVEEALGTNEFWRVRVGIENRDKGEGVRVEGEEYVLQEFTEEERGVMSEVFPKIAQALIAQLRRE